MKKLIFLIFVFVTFGFSLVHAADTKVEIKNMQADTITVHGTAQNAADIVSLIIFNPGFSEENVESGNYESYLSAVQYMGAMYPENGKYCFNIKMRDTSIPEGGGEYRVIVKDGETKIYDMPYTFYFNEFKKNAILDLNRENSIDTLTADIAYKRFGMSDYPLYKKTKKGEIAAALTMLKEQYEGKNFPIDTEDFETVLKNAALLAAYNKHDAALLTEAGYILYTDVLAVDGTQYLSDYKNDITDAARNKINSELINGNYGSINEISTALSELVAYYGIILNKNGGTGHIDKYFEKYADIYEKYGFNINRLEANKKSRIYAALLGCRTTNIRELAAAFNSLVLNPPIESDKNTSVNGGGPGGFKPVSPDSNKYIENEKTFSDIENVEWAKEAIGALKKKGVINGRTENIFAPNDCVTRAEFLKMIVLALNLPTGSSECIFSDVNEKWSVPYIVSAYENGIAAGITENTFEPNSYITREMGAAFSARALRVKKIATERDESLFADDEAISEYAKEDIYCLKNAGIVSGVGGNEFNPKGKMTRAEAAMLIFELMIFCGVNA